MAVNLTQKNETTARGLFAIEKVALGYTLFTSALILVLYARMDRPFMMLMERLIILCMTLSLMEVYRRFPCRLSALVRICFQLGLLSYWYPDTYEFNRVFPNLDHVFAAAEQWLFGMQPALVFHEALPQKWFSEALHLGYLSYYPLIAFIVLWYFWKRFRDFERVAFIMEFSFIFYYLLFIFIPVAGPQFYFPAIGLQNALQGVFPHIGDYFNTHQQLAPSTEYYEGFFYNLVEGSQAIGERPTAAFPSSHVGISTIIMIIAARTHRKMFSFLLPFYVLLCCATVYIQAHYVIDALAGFVSAFFIYGLACLCFDCWFVRPDPGRPD